MDKSTTAVGSIPDIVFSATTNSETTSGVKPREATIDLGKWTITVHPGPYTSALVTWPPNVKVAEGQQQAKMDWHTSTTEGQGPAWLMIHDKTGGASAYTEAEGSGALTSLGGFTFVVRFQHDPLTEEFQQKIKGAVAGEGIERP